jgi:Peptidase family M28
VFRLSGVVLFLSSLLCTPSIFAQHLVFLRLDRKIVDERLKLAPEDPAKRVKTLRDLFEKGGCRRDQIVEQQVPKETLPNLICTLPGDQEGAIVVGARLDYTDHGDRGLVRWGSVAMLPLLVESLSAVAHRHTFVFVAFTGHSNSRGSSWYLQKTSEVKAQSIRAALNLDSLGRSPVAYSLGQYNYFLGNVLVGAAQSLHWSTAPEDITPYKFMLRSHAATAKPSGLEEEDSKPFVQRDIPTITLYSPVNVPVPGLRDVTGSQATAWKTKLDPDIYEGTYHLLCVFLLSLDIELDRKPRKPDEVFLARSPAEAAKTPFSEPAARTSAETVTLPDTGRGQLLRPQQQFRLKSLLPLRRAR